MGLETIRRLLAGGYVFFICPVEVAELIGHAAGLTRSDMRMITDPSPFLALKATSTLRALLGLHPEEWSATRAVIPIFAPGETMIISVYAYDVDAGASVVYEIMLAAAELMRVYEKPSARSA